MTSAVYAAKSYGKVDSGDMASHPFVSADDATWVESLWLARTAPAARVVFKCNSK